jgi:predicted DNA-binding protein YlxM (UPF0122 family)
MKKHIIEDYPREYLEHLIDQWIFDWQARVMLKRHFLDGITYEDLAEELDVSRATVYNKITKYFDKLCKHLD